MLGVRGIWAVAIVLLLLFLPAMAAAPVRAEPGDYVALNYTYWHEGFEDGLCNWSSRSYPYERVSMPNSYDAEWSDITQYSGSWSMYVTGDVCLYELLPIYPSYFYDGWYKPFWFNFSFRAPENADFVIYMKNNSTTALEYGIGFDADLYGFYYNDGEGTVFINSSVAYGQSYYDSFNEGGVPFNHHGDMSHSLINDTWQKVSIFMDYDGGGECVPGIFFYINDTLMESAGANCFNNHQLIANATDIWITCNNAYVFIDDISIQYYNYTQAPPPTEPDTFQFLFSMDYLIFLLMVLIPTVIMWAKLGEMAVAPTFDLMCVVAWISNMIPLGVLIIALLISLGTYINRREPENG